MDIQFRDIPSYRWKRQQKKRSGRPIPGHPELPVEKAAEIKKDQVSLDLLLFSNLVQQELSRMNINSLSLLEETMQVTPQVMRMLGELLEREVTRDDPEWASVMASVTVSEKVNIKPSRRQHKENERNCRTKVHQLVYSIPKNVLTSTSCKRKEQVKGTRRKTVTFEDQGQKGEEDEQNLGQDSLSGEKEVEEDIEEDSSIDDNSRNSGIDTYSDRNSSTGLELSELAIHMMLLVETRARYLDREVYQYLDSDRYLVPRETVLDNAADDLETIVVSKRSMSLLPQKKVNRTDLQPFRQETEPLAKNLCVKMEDDTHQHDETNSQLKVMKTYLKATYRLSDLL